MYTPEAELEVLRRVTENSNISTNIIATELSNMNASLVWRSLREQQLYPFHILCVIPDYDSRLGLGRFLRNVAENPNFADNILFTDTFIFTNNVIIIFHNVWSDENPHTVFELRHTHRVSLNV